MLSLPSSVSRSRRMASLVLVGLMLLSLLFSQAWASSEFVIKDIRIEGLRRISAGTVFNYLPLQVGDKLTSTELAASIRALYKTRFFKDIRMERDGDILVVVVNERPAVTSIEIEGNKDIEDEPLLAALKSEGMSPGQVFDRSLLDKIERELRLQYFSRGKYSVDIKVTVTPLERNRVAIIIDIDEGKAARISEVAVVGNTIYSDEDILDDFSLANDPWYRFWASGEQYSKQQLSGDLEKLKSKYLDKGYIKFKIDSTQVSITPDKKDIFVTVNLNEGELHTVSSVKLVGDLVVDEAELFSKIQISEGDTFSRKAIVESANAISDVLGVEGYAFANVNPVPEIDEEGNTVKLSFFVDPGNRVYVRRIEFRGNTKSRDEVLRREMRQMEGSWFSAKDVERSKQRLDRLGFFEKTDVKTDPVADTTDQVDIKIAVKEQPSGNLIAGLGFSQTSGVVINASVSQDNFLGSGKRVGLSVNNSNVNTAYSFSFSDPYYTIDGVSRGFALRFQETDAAQANLAKFSTDVFGGSVTYGIPLNEFDRVRATIRPEVTKLTAGSTASAEINTFLATNGSTFKGLSLELNWSRDSRNRAIFADKGSFHSITSELFVPGSDLTFYTLRYKYKLLHKLAKNVVYAANFDVGFGDGYGNTNDLPFFRNFYAGGPGSIRGFRANTVGPRDSANDPFGGNLKTVMSMEVAVPGPFKQFRDKTRVGAFWDLGGVFSNNNFNTGNLRTSVGVAVRWLTPVGPMTFSLGYPLNDKTGDEVERFQFTLGASF